jgi:hypothetical protein
LPLEPNQSLPPKNAKSAVFGKDDRLSVLTPWNDYAVFTQPHVAEIRNVLHGVRFRYKFTVENAVVLFDHGCLMGRIYYQGHFFALPPLEEEADGTPCLRALPITQQTAIAEFCRLPKGILLFYFTLLKQVFAGRTLTCRQWSTNGQNHRQMPIPAPLRPWLHAVGWPYVSESTGCRAS